ncbi:MAG: ATP-dependent DNA helicase RecQ [Acidobacteria bacterium]|nr:ATP-dependent DNA helicase RecQ [Acidobacteriota bacterium]
MSAENSELLPDQLLEVLRRHWGYSSFLPLQDRIVESLLAGRDACVVMPTGGGKSLCYQLPAALRPEQTVVVISPLIALMQDQVAQLDLMGISAAAINSTFSEAERGKVMRQATKGAYRLLYLSPERLAREDTTGWLRQVPVSLFAIDEAHCISEWGHEFRPDYRQLSSLRANFPDCAIAAFTASATRRVRHDIIEQLQLRAPDKYIASFHRPNLRYLVRQCTSREQPGLLRSVLQRHSGASIIVYEPTIARVEGTTDWLNQQGIPTTSYHGKMGAATRRDNQERWMSDEVRVLVGTLAFGLGINKPGVRAVVHTSLPKSIEQYYQEAGRAGRDGQPADCILLWQKRDAGLLAHFNEQIQDADERERAWQRYHEIRDFAERPQCRHRRICTHFGETPKWSMCSACDVCGQNPEWLVDVYGMSTTQSKSRKRKRGATAATTASAPKKDSPRYPAGPPAELAASQRSQPAESSTRRHADRPATRSADWPAEQHPLAPVYAASLEQSAPAAEPDHELREHLRAWRRKLAHEKGIPAFIIMHDRSLDEICQLRPRAPAELLEVFGFGERKVAAYGAQIIAALEEFLNRK